MAFHDVTLPTGLSYGSLAGPGFGTIIQESATGHEVRITRQAQPRHQLRLGKELLTDAELSVMKSFVIARRGSLHSFRVPDINDYTTNSSDGITAATALDQVLGTGDGTEDTFQLVKHYDYAGPGQFTRTLTLPVSGSVLVALDGTPTTSFTLSGDGQIVFASAPTAGQIITAGCSFYVPVRFGDSIDKWMRMSSDAFQRSSITDLDLVEVLNEVEWPERRQNGGSRYWDGVTSNVAIAFNDGYLLNINAAAAIDATLPVPTYQESGGDIFTIMVPSGASGSVQVRDDSGNALGSVLSAGDWVRIGLSRDGDAYTWWAI